MSIIKYKWTVCVSYYYSTKYLVNRTQTSTGCKICIASLHKLMLSVLWSVVRTFTIVPVLWCKKLICRSSFPGEQFEVDCSINLLQGDRHKTPADQVKGQRTHFGWEMSKLGCLALVDPHCWMAGNQLGDGCLPLDLYCINCIIDNNNLILKIK